MKARTVLALLLATGLLAACAQLVGIEDRELGESTEVVVSPLCREYCDTVLDACPQNYTGEATCLGTCALLPEGDPLEPASTPNSVQCRLQSAQFARAAGAGDNEDFCKDAAPGGNGTCGDDCESYCMLVEAACDNARIPDCEAKCRAFGVSDTYDVASGADHEGDTVQCRLVHVTSAAADPEDAGGHCAHADLHPSDWCDGADAVDEGTECERYCRVVRVACQDDLALYDNDEQCMATCEALELGNARDQIEDTVGCRTWHGISSLLDPETHCSHAGPTGDGHCGLDVLADEDEGIEAEFAACRPYCRLLEAACGDQFAATWADQDECIEECDQSDEDFAAALDQKYSVSSAETSGDTLGCRTLHAVRAFEDDANCEAAFGASPCN